MMRKSAAADLRAAVSKDGSKRRCIHGSRRERCALAPHHESQRSFVGWAKPRSGVPTSPAWASLRSAHPTACLAKSKLPSLIRLKSRKRLLWQNSTSLQEGVERNEGLSLSAGKPRPSELGSIKRQGTRLGLGRR